MPREQFCLDGPSDGLRSDDVYNDNPMNPKVVAAARRKGFAAVTRLQRNSYYALRCLTCSEIVRARHSVVLHHQPTCKNCQAMAHKTYAWTAGLRLLRRDPDNRHYGVYLAECGHEVRREFGFVQRMARGEVDVRCDICLLERQKATARERGWLLSGPDPECRIGYRLYQHVNCGGMQPVAMANMETGRFDCNRCGVMWPAAQSSLYVMEIMLKNQEPVVKLGFSKNPRSRLNHQLLSGYRTTGRLLRVVDVSNGAAAIKIEKSMHKRLREDLPEARVPLDHFAGQIRVKSEIYRSIALPLIDRLLDEIDAPS